MVDLGKLEHLCIIGENAKWHSTVGNTLAVPQKVRPKLPYDPVILLLDIQPRELETHVHAKTCT